jgi:hypothetical protein
MSRAIKQARADPILECFDPSAKGGLADGAALRRAREATSSTTARKSSNHLVPISNLIVNLPIEITAKVVGNSILAGGGACPQTRSKQAQIGNTQVAPRFREWGNAHIACASILVWFRDAPVLTLPREMLSSVPSVRGDGEAMLRGIQ